MTKSTEKKNKSSTGTPVIYCRLSLLIESYGFEVVTPDIKFVESLYLCGVLNASQIITRLLRNLSIKGKITER